MMEDVGDDYGYRCRGTYSIMRWDWICASLWLAIPLGRRILSGFIWIAGHWRSGRRLTFVKDDILEMPGSYSLMFFKVAVRFGSEDKWWVGWIDQIEK